MTDTSTTAADAGGVGTRRRLCHVIVIGPRDAIRPVGGKRRFGPFRRRSRLNSVKTTRYSCNSLRLPRVPGLPCRVVARSGSEFTRPSAGRRVPSRRYRSLFRHRRSIRDRHSRRRNTQRMGADRLQVRGVFCGVVSRRAEFRLPVLWSSAGGTGLSFLFGLAGGMRRDAGEVCVELAARVRQRLQGPDAQPGQRRVPRVDASRLPAIQQSTGTPTIAILPTQTCVGA